MELEVAIAMGPDSNVMVDAEGLHKCDLIGDGGEMPLCDACLKATHI